MSKRALIIAGMVVTLLLAGVVSYYASSSPDGLNKVATDRGFNKGEEPHDLEDGPFAGYESSFIDNGRFSGAVAGIVGVGATFLLVGGLALAVRRRGDGDAARVSDDRDASSARR